MHTAMETAKNVLEKLEAAWNRADGKAYGAAFTDDGAFVDIRGGLHRGAVAIGAGHQAVFDSIFAGSRAAYRAVDAQAVAPDVIVAHRIASLHNALAEKGTPAP
jgi:uncharacterized protein (TIGR02246 family)